MSIGIPPHHLDGRTCDASDALTLEVALASVSVDKGDAAAVVAGRVVDAGDVGGGEGGVETVVLGKAGDGGGKNEEE